MNCRDDELRQRFKAEVDDLLFNHMHFDARQQEKVMQGIRIEAEFSAKRAKRSLHWRKWLAGSVVAAAIIGSLPIIGPSLMQKYGEPPVSILSAEGEGTGHPAITDVQPLLGALDRPQNNESGDNTLTHSLEELNETLSGRLLVPEFVPEGFTLVEARTETSAPGSGPVAVLRYADGSRFFEIRQTKELEFDGATGDNRMEVKGIPVYMFYNKVQIEDGTGASDSDVSREADGITLKWHMDGIQYVIDGTLTEEEAADIVIALIDTQRSKQYGGSNKNDQK